MSFDLNLILSCINNPKELTKEQLNLLKEFNETKTNDPFLLLLKQFTLFHVKAPDYVIDSNSILPYKSDFLKEMTLLSTKLELKSFQHCFTFKAETKEWPPLPLNKKITSSSGMRLGITSCNASDNLTYSALYSGQALNACVFVNGHSIEVWSAVLSKEQIWKQFQLKPKVEKARILFLSNDQMEPVGLKNQFMSFLNFDYLNDKTNHFRFFQHALLFTGFFHKSTNYSLFDLLNGASYENLENRLPRDYLLVVYLNNPGPSRSGFASSSAFTVNLLNSLFQLSSIESSYWSQGKEENSIELNGFIGWLFENQLNLRSGRQDIDAPLKGGMNLWHYGETKEDFTMEIKQKLIQQFPFRVSYENLNQYFPFLKKRLLLLNTKKKRNDFLGHERSLHSLHLIHLSRNPIYLKEQEKTRNIYHSNILKGIQNKDAELIGQNMTQYWQSRCRMQQWPDFDLQKPDVDNLNALVLSLFYKLKCIEGGLLPGAGGGGLSLSIMTERALEEVTFDDLKNEISNTSFPFQLKYPDNEMLPKLRYQLLIEILRWTLNIDIERIEIDLDEKGLKSQWQIIE